LQGYLLGLQKHRQILSQHVRKVVCQGLCPSIVVGQGNTILGDPGNYLVLIEVSGQVDRPEPDRRLHRPWRADDLRFPGFRKRAEGKDSPWMFLLLADVYARGEAEPGEPQERQPRG
jgi:hypothetical protein